MAADRAGGRNPGFGRCPGASAQWPREISTGTILAVGREKRSPRSVSGSSRIERCGDRFIQQVRICAVGPPAELLFPSHRSGFTAKTQTHRLVPKYPWFALDSRFAWSYVRLRRARLRAKHGGFMQQKNLICCTEEERMAAIQRNPRDILLDTDADYQRLFAEHEKYDSELQRILKEPYLNSEDLLEEIKLKKMKLHCKDEMERIARIQRSHAHHA